jgi:hypothetical protein
MPASERQQRAGDRKTRQIPSGIQAAPIISAALRFKEVVVVAGHQIALLTRIIALASRWRNEILMHFARNPNN